MAHAQKPDLVFQAKRTSTFKSAGVSSRLLAAEECYQRTAFVWTVFRRTVQDHWQATPFASFPFTSPQVRHRVSSGSERAILISDTGLVDPKAIVRAEVLRQ